MTDWIEHNGGPQPVADDVWVEWDEGEYDTLVGPASDHDWGLYDTDQESVRYRILNQHLIDAARFEGIRLGLEAAAKAVCKAEIKASPEGKHIDGRGHQFAGLAEATDLIRNLDPATIAKEQDQ